MKKILLSLAIVICTLQAMEPTNNLKVYTIPGVNGLGSEPDYVRSILGNNCEIVPIETPTERYADLGQGNCQSFLINKLEKETEGVVIHATSQGAATALNVLAQEHALFKDGLWKRRIKALILEGTVASGNSAIYHTITGPLGGYEIFKHIPLSYYFLPYAAKIGAFPSYWPCGQQPIASISDIPNDVPIIIIHSREDPQVSYRDAYALFSGLIQKGKNAYFIPFEGSHHIQILDDENKKNIVRAILSEQKLIKTNLSKSAIEEILYLTDNNRRICKYQLYELGTSYSDLKWKEYKHRAFAYTAAMALAALVVKGLWSLYNKLWSKSKSYSNKQNGITKPVGNTKIIIQKGDITKSDAQAIVNAANPQLLSGGGVCGAIFNAAGCDQLQEACNNYPIYDNVRCPVGYARITDSFRLKPKIQYIIHAVGPDCRIVKNENQQNRLLKSAYKESLRIADEHNITSIAFPFISSAIYAFEKKRAARIAVESVNEYLKENTGLRSIHFVLFFARRL